jgi:hypothetical protein
MKTRAEKVPWLPSVFLMVVTGIIGPLWISTLTAPMALFNLGVVGSGISLTPLPFLVILLGGLMGNLKPLKGRINSGNLAYIYAAMIASSFYIGYQSWQSWPWYNLHYAADRVLSPNWADMYIPSLMAPPAEAVKGWLIAGTPVPWASWLPSIATWGVLSLLFALLSASVSCIFRKIWIDVERLPFPQTALAFDLSLRVTGERRWTRTFYVGILLGLAFQLPIYLQSLFPWFPDIYGWRVNTCCAGVYYIPIDSPLATLVGFSRFMKNPVVGVIFYLAPVSVLFNAWFWYVVLDIIGTQVAYMMGYYSGILTTPGCGRVWCASPIGTEFSKPFEWVAFGSIGGALGFVLYTLFGQRAYISKTLHAAFGGLGSDELKEMERGEPLSYRAAYLTFIASFALLALLWMALGLGPVAATLMPLSFLLSYIPGALIYARIGYCATLDTSYSMWVYKALWPGTPNFPPPYEWNMAMFFSITYNGNGFQYGSPAAMSSSLAAFNMASSAKVSNRNVFKLWLLASAIVPVISMISGIYSIYALGATKNMVTSGYTCAAIAPDTGCTEASRSNSWPAAEPWVPNVIVGALSVILIGLLHARYVWFPFEPVGFLLATTTRPILEGIWTMCLAAWIAKWLTLRIGGSKTYEAYGIPLATGFVIGYLILIPIGGLVSIIKFFHPF